MSEDPSYLAGHFRSVREALDEMIPADMVPVGITASQNLVDVDMAIVKGICAGTLALCSASQVAAFNTDDTPPEILNPGWDGTAGGMSTDFNSYDELGNAVAACYSNHIPPSDRMTIDLSTESFLFVVHVKRWVWPSADCDNLIEVHLEADGGPPSLLFFTRRETNAK